MRRKSLLVVLLLVFSFDAGRQVYRRGQKPNLPRLHAGFLQPDSQTRARISESYGKLPLSFAANQGQTDSAVRFLARGNGYQLHLKATEAELRLRTAAGAVPGAVATGSVPNQHPVATAPGTAPETQSASVRMKLVNANPAPQMAGRAELPGKSHYYIGNDPKNWRTNVANYAKVEYEQVWPGINLVYYGNQRQLEYDFIVAPGAQPDTISFSFDGADNLKLDAQGNLVLHVAGGAVVMQKPFVYQERNGARQQIAGNYQIQNPKSKIQNPLVGFHIGDYDKNLPLVIDPVLVYSTYLGPASRDIANDIAVDQAGNVYITGASFFSSEGWNAFVAKLNAAGTMLVYSTALIGSRDEIGFGVAVDAAGNAYATGFTRSTNFPARNAYQSRLGATDCRNAIGCPDAFVVKLEAAGTIAYSTYLGGNDNPGDISAFGDLGYDIAVDGSGQAVVTGSTVSRNFPVKNAYQPAGGVGAGSLNTVNDGFITKFNAAGNDLVYSTYLGGNGIDACHGIALDAAGNAYVTGQTNRVFNDVVNSFPTTANAFQRTPAADLQDGFVTKLNAAGSALVYSTYLGGNDRDQGEAIAVDSSGHAYVIGATTSTNFPLDGAHQAVNLGGSAFVTKLNPSGSALLYSSYLGKQVWPRTGTSPGAAIAVDAAGMAYVIGSTSAADFPVVNALYPTFGGGSRDAYIAKINTVAKTVVYVTYLGGSLTDYGFGIALDAAGNVYVTGATNSANFPLKNPLQPALGSSDFNEDTFVTKIGEDSGPCGTLGLQATEPEQAQDTLQIAEAQPGNSTPISGALLKLGGLKVTVRYLLQSRANAVLKVRLYDEDGRERAALDGEIDIARPQSCPNPLPTREFNVVPRTVDFTPLFFGSVPTSLRLSAQMLDAQTGGIFKSVELIYRVIPDVIAFESNPTINGKAAPDGSTFPEDGKIKFDCGLRYHLTNDERGKLRLEAFSFTGQSIARKDFAATVPATAQPVTVGFALDFEFTVPSDVSQVTIQARLLAENGSVLKLSVPLTYRRAGFGIALGTYAAERFEPFVTSGVLVAGGSVQAAFGLIEPAPLGLGVTEDLNLPNDSVAELFLSEKKLDGTYLRKDQQMPKSPSGPFPRPDWRITLPRARDDADQWELRLVFFLKDKDPVASKPLLLNIDRVRIVPKQCTPPNGAELQRGKTERFRCKLEYNVNRPGQSLLFAYVEYNSFSGLPPIDTKLLELKAGDRSPADPPFRDFNVPIPSNDKVKAVRISFVLGNDDLRVARSQVIEYNSFIEKVKIPNAIATVTTSLGITFNIQKGVDKTVDAVRRATQFKGLLDSFGLKLGAELESGAPGAPPFAARYAAAASLLREFIGVNAFWEFNPPIPADGSFVADLTFSYDAEMLPDDPNFNEAALKVVSFDPDTGQLVSFPTTVNTTAKTATARVNGLARYYTLGVFGPFAQRTLNFPVLQNSDTFNTRFNLVNAGTPNAGNGDAALSLRAYDDTGANLQAPDLLNPLTSTLAAARMLTGSFSDLFKASAPLEGWVQTRANRNVVAGYELLTSGNRFDGLVAPSGYDSVLILPEAVYDATQTTEIHLANATNFSGVVTLALHDATGRRVASEEIQLAPKARFAQRLQDTFQNLTQSFTGYLLILSERDLAAAAVQVLEKEISALNAQPLGGGATKLYAPYLSLGGPTVARLTLVNPASPAGPAANLTLRLLNPPGAPTTAPVNLTLGAGQQLQRDLSQLFTLDQLSLTYATLIVESDTAGLAGNVTLFNPSAAIPFRATLPLERAPANRLIFAHFNTSDGFYTELGIFNPSAQAARVTLACFKPDGASLGQTTINVPANTVFGDFLDAQVSGARGQAAGYFTLSSDQPIVAGAAFGTEAGSALAALPPQILPSANTNALASVSAASFQGQTLAPDSIVAAFGVNLANSVVVANQTPLPTTLADTTVEVRDSLGATRRAPLFFVAPGQINYLIPPGTANGAATIIVTNGAGALSQGNVTIASVAPGLFTANANGQGVPAAVIVRVANNGAQTYESVSRFDPATQRFVAAPLEFTPDTSAIVLVLFGTGWRFRSALTATTVTIGGVTAPVLFVGAQPTLAGLDQINVELPRSLSGRGEVDVVVMVDGKVANTVRVNIK